MGARKPDPLADARTWAGYRSAHVARQTGTVVVVVNSVEAGLEDDDPDLRWATICDAHSTLVMHPTRRLAEAHAVDPQGWCEQCRHNEAEEVAS